MLGSILGSVIGRTVVGVAASPIVTTDPYAILDEGGGEILDEGGGTIQEEH